MIIKDLSADVRELPLVQLEQAVLLYQRNDLHEAKKIFLALEAFDADADFAQEASHYLRLIRVHEIVSQEGHETSQQEGRVFHGK